MLSKEVLELIRKKNKTKRLLENEMISLIQKIEPDIVKLGKLSKTDCFSKKLNMVFELKSRKGHWSTLGIEKHKWTELVSFKKSNVRFIVSTTEGLYSFNIHKLPEPRWYWKYGPSSTYDDDGSWEWKWVGYYNIKQAKDLTYLLD